LKESTTNSATPPLGLKTFLYQGTNHAITIAFQLLAIIFVARNLGPSGLGQLALIQTIYILLRPIAEIGTRGYLIREFLNNPQNSRSWAISANKLNLKISLIVLTIFLVTLGILDTTKAEWLNKWNAQLNLWAICLSAVLISAPLELKGYSQLLLKLDLKTLLRRDLLTSVGSSLLKLGGALYIENPSFLIIFVFLTMSLESIARGGWNYYFFNKGKTSPNQLCQFKKSDRSGQSGQQTQLLLEGLKYLPSELSLTSEGQIAKLWVNSLGGATLGNFSIAQKQNIIFKTFNRMCHDNDLEAPKIKLAVKYGLVACIASACIAPLIPYIYGQDFKDASLYAYLLIVPNFLALVGSKVSSKLIRASMTTSASRSNMMGLAITISLCFYLVPTLGVLGACLAMSLGWIGQIVLGIYLLKTHKMTIVKA
jgi:hypothetical protein